jgi:hypothetical protein
VAHGPPNPFLDNLPGLVKLPPGEPEGVIVHLHADPPGSLALDFAGRESRIASLISSRFGAFGAGGGAAPTTAAVTPPEYGSMVSPRSSGAGA